MASKKEDKPKSSSKKSASSIAKDLQVAAAAVEKLSAQDKDKSVALFRVKAHLGNAISNLKLL